MSDALKIQLKALIIYIYLIIVMLKTYLMQTQNKG